MQCYRVHMRGNLAGTVRVELTLRKRSGMSRLASRSTVQFAQCPSTSSSTRPAVSIANGHHTDRAGMAVGRRQRQSWAANFTAFLPSRA